jgi:hypothetical protein
MNSLESANKLVVRHNGIATTQEMEQVEYLGREVTEQNDLYSSESIEESMKNNGETAEIYNNNLNAATSQNEQQDGLNPGYIEFLNSFQGRQYLYFPLQNQANQDQPTEVARDAVIHAYQADYFPLCKDH